MAKENISWGYGRIRIDGGTQPRVAIDEQVVADYAELYSTGADLPPVTVFFDGAAYWLADGFHRYWANKRIDCERVFAEVRQGTQRDAIIYSVGANSEHGLRRSNEDKRKAAATMLTNNMVANDEEGRPWSDREIANLCNVSHPFVTKMRERLASNHTGNVSSMDGRSDSERQFIHHKTGQPATMNTANISRANRSRRRSGPKPGGISPNAMTPIRGHSTHKPKTALELPHDPHWAARAVLSAMGNDFARALVKELTTYLEGNNEQ